MPISRSPRPGSNWNEADLSLLNFKLDVQKGTEFFGEEPGPINNLDPNLLLSIDQRLGADLSKETYHFLANLQCSGAYYDDPTQESALHEFTAIILQVIGYDKNPLMLRRYFDIRFTNCGEEVESRTDIALYHPHFGLILLVVRIASSEAENFRPRIIADAIAAFEHNNKMRAEYRLPTLDEMVIPCITVLGTRPYFYRVPVTQELSDAVKNSNGGIPSEPTTVTFCLPPFLCGNYSVRMEEPEYRQTGRTARPHCLLGFPSRGWNETFSKASSHTRWATIYSMMDYLDIDRFTLRFLNTMSATHDFTSISKMWNDARLDFIQQHVHQGI